jgi:hypothetical protein
VSADVATVVLSVCLAIIVAASAGLLTIAQIRRERRLWLTDVKLAWSLELHKARLAAYPAAFAAMAPLSTHHRPTLTPEVAADVAEELNTWLYSTGGMCAEATTRGAILGLRDSCDRWASSDALSRPPQLYEFRNLAITFLRRDLDLGEVEAFDLDSQMTLLNRLRGDLDATVRRAATSDSNSARDLGVRDDL